MAEVGQLQTGYRRRFSQNRVSGSRDWPGNLVRRPNCVKSLRRSSIPDSPGCGGRDAASVRTAAGPNEDHRVRLPPAKRPFPLIA